MSRFQSTRPRRARHKVKDLLKVPGKFQSTRPRRARLYHFAFFREVESVSIHAPTQGATLSGRQPDMPTDVSIHAPTQGATIHLRPSIPDDCVSIHAPTQGATTAPSPSINPRSCFNPRAHAGRDRLIRDRRDTQR